MDCFHKPFQPMKFSPTKQQQPPDTHVPSPNSAVSDKPLVRSRSRDELRSVIDVLESTAEISRLTTQLSTLSSELSNTKTLLTKRTDELTQCRFDLEILGEKLTDAIEGRAELIHDKESIQEELEELTKSLFEEANSMVANEARQRHEHQENVI